MNWCWWLNLALTEQTQECSSCYVPGCAQVTLQKTACLALTGESCPHLTEPGLRFFQ